MFCQSHPVWQDESNYMRIISSVKQSSPSAKAVISVKYDGLASQAESCNLKVENTYNL